MANTKPLPKSPIWCRVPFDAKLRACRGTRCVQQVYDGYTEKNGRKVAVDCDIEGGVHPNAVHSKDGRGVSHFQTCVDVGQFNAGRP